MTPTFEQQENARKVLDRIESRPGNHDQGSWISPAAIDDANICGTTACVAGWTIILCENKSPRDFYQESLHSNEFIARAVKYLGLEDTSLFYLNSEETAKEALRYIANGKEIDWETLEGDYDCARI